MAIKTLDEETNQKVIRQVEFYFSDSNLVTDKFLRKTISESEDGMVSLALICSFSRMRTHLSLGDAKGVTDVQEETVMAVAETLRKSTFLKVSEEGKMVGRTTELVKPEEVIEQIDGRTVAASPLEHNVLLEDIESYFGKFGKVNSVRLACHVADKRMFCGTALIEFSTVEDAEKIMKQSLVYGGLELELKPKKEFDAEQAKEAKKVETIRPAVPSNHKKNTVVEHDYPKGLIVAFTLMSKSGVASAPQNGNQNSDNCNKNSGNIDGEVESVDEKIVKVESVDEKIVKVESVDEKIAVSEEKPEDISVEIEGKEIEDEKKSVKGPTEEVDVKMVGERKSSADVYKENMDVVTREDLKKVFQNYGFVKFIDFSIGDKSGYIRYEEPEGAQKARAAAVLSDDGGLIIKNYIANLEPVIGEVEKEYWNRLRSGQDRYHNNNKGNRGRGGRFSRGGKFSRSRENDNGYGRANKVRKTGA